MRFPIPHRAGLIAGAAAALLLAIGSPVAAKIDRTKLEKQVAQQFDARVLKIREGTLDGQEVLFITMMRERANSNAAFKVDTLAFDPVTGEALRGRVPEGGPQDGSRRDTTMIEKRPDVLRGRPWR